VKKVKTLDVSVNGNGHRLRVSESMVDSLTPAQKALHRNYLESVKTMKKGLVRAAYYLEKISALGIYRMLGFKKISTYAEAYGGFTPDQTERFLHLARRLPEFPQVAAALESQGLSWGKARVIVTRGDPKDQGKWLELAQSVSIRTLAGAVGAGVLPARRSPASKTDSGQLLVPPDVSLASAKNLPVQGVQIERDLAPRLQATVHYVTLKFDSEGLARWNRALESGMQRSKVGCKEEAVLAGLGALVAPNQGKAGSVPSTLLTIIECPTCCAGNLPTGRGESPASPALLAAAQCDAKIEDVDGLRRQNIAPLMRRKAFKRARYTCEAKSCERTNWLQVHHRRPVAGAGRNDLNNLVILCSGCHRALHNADDAAKDVDEI
jgi:hypothetical protein